jgi:excisionase family DNA binding protein
MTRTIPYLTVTQVSRKAKCTRRYVLDEIAAGRLSYYAVGDPNDRPIYLVSLSDFEEWMENPRRGSRSISNADLEYVDKLTDYGRNDPTE